MSSEDRQQPQYHKTGRFAVGKHMGMGGGHIGIGGGHAIAGGLHLVMRFAMGACMGIGGQAPIMGAACTGGQ